MDFSSIHHFHHNNHISHHSLCYLATLLVPGEGSVSYSKTYNIKLYMYIKPDWSFLHVNVCMSVLFFFLLKKACNHTDFYIGSYCLNYSFANKPEHSSRRCLYVHIYSVLLSITGWCPWFVCVVITVTIVIIYFTERNFFLKIKSIFIIIYNLKMK